jgi:SagB-type dehydrogenase family enzyme
MTRAAPTAQFASLVYGTGGVPGDDPAEAYHEASRLYPNVAPPQLAMLLELSGSDELRQTVARSSRTHGHRAGVILPRALPLHDSLDDLVARRRSGRAELSRAVRLPELAAVLAASYAATDHPGGGSRRPVPSGGALYPLELYAIALAVHGLERGIYHYDPFGHRLAQLDRVRWHRLREAFVEPALLDSASVVLVVTAMFWRSRCKYGARGYRFALIEAGHLAQNTLLAATALDLPALPVGGFYDRRLDRLVGADSLDEATLYALVLGGSG